MQRLTGGSGLRFPGLAPPPAPVASSAAVPSSSGASGSLLNINFDSLLQSAQSSVPANPPLTRYFITITIFYF